MFNICVEAGENDRRLRGQGKGKEAVSEGSWVFLELRVQNYNTVNICWEGCWHIFPYLGIFINALRILYNAFLSYLPPFPTPPVSTLYNLSSLPTLNSLLPSSGRAFVTQILLGVGPALDYGQPTSGHIIKEYWLSPSSYQMSIALS